MLIAAEAEIIGDGNPVQNIVELGRQQLPAPKAEQNNQRRAGQQARQLVGEKAEYQPAEEHRRQQKQRKPLVGLQAETAQNQVHQRDHRQQHQKQGADPVEKAVHRQRTSPLSTVNTRL